MSKLNQTDQEIINILKEVFLTKNIKPLSSDEHLRIWIIRSFFVVSVIGIFLRILLMAAGKEVPVEFSATTSVPIAVFFGILFLHINNKSKNSSLIIFVLTWISIVISLYF